MVALHKQGQNEPSVITSMVAGRGLSLGLLTIYRKTKIRFSEWIGTPGRILTRDILVRSQALCSG